ncbi:MAG: hypothetical protein ABIY70_00040 [Capsulimonas sp.]|uniref:hypothetical protein n=1 Tax=Capsulimonas sp. TaxID=2494211 RepID=UPI003266AD28
MKTNAILRLAISMSLMMLATTHAWGDTTIATEKSETALMSSSNWGNIVEGLQVKAESHSLDYHVGDRVMLDATLMRLASDETATREPRLVADYMSAGQYFDIQVKDAAGHDVPLTSYGKTVQHDASASVSDLPIIGNFFRNRSIRVTLDKGGSAIYHFWLSRIFDLSLAGSYAVTLTFGVTSHDAKQVVKIVSNVATIQILPAQASDPLENFQNTPTIVSPAKP